MRPRSGHVYVLLNPAFPDLVKIGRTTVSPRERAKQLSGPSGVPTAFMVVYEEYVADCVTLEQLVHRALRPCRVNDRREFYRIEASEAIRTVQREKRRLCGDSSASEYEILGDLLRIHGRRRIRSFTSVKIVVTEECCYLETTRRCHPHNLDEIIERTDLTFIADDDAYDDDADMDEWEQDRSMFDPADDAQDNAMRFLDLDLDLLSLANCTDLLTTEAIDELRPHPAGQQASLFDDPRCRSWSSAW